MSSENQNDQPLYPPPGSNQDQPRTVSSPDGRPLSDLGPDDVVVVGRKPDSTHGRDMIIPAGNVLDDDGRPIWEAPDGAIRHLDPNQTTVRLAGEAIAHTFRPKDPRLEK